MRTTRSSKKSFTDQAAEIVEQVSPHVEAARDRIVNDYLPAAQSVLADARDAAQDAAVQVEKSTRKRRKKAAKNARAKARELVDTAVAAAPAGMPLVEKVQSKPKRKKRFLLLLALLGAGAIVAKRLRGETPTAAPYAPPRPAPTPRPAPVSEDTVSTPVPPAPPVQHFEPDPAEGGVSDAGPGGVAEEGTTDAGGAFLDEVIADSQEEPGKVTTPDQPAEVEDVSGPKSRKG
jgi:hypothetical protein